MNRKRADVTGPGPDRFYHLMLNTQSVNEQKLRKILDGECLSLSFSTYGINICEKSAVSNGKPAIEYLVKKVVQNLKKLEFGVAFNARSETIGMINFFNLVSKIVLQRYCREFILESVKKVLKKNLSIGDKGIKTKCHLEDLQYFHPILNSIIDIMHSIYMGAL
ncbi:hypothetical protein BpHYR1_037536 [Brachionus plicatilis]|uniref:Uncharacterized protein n=1 Tax=Brachionus plicatilis TaxID=10195 RepID=A0A3M7RZU1_BRAPC|nr:hypothetical protein BpHYR1_037536 [Brachionus plicatilis]